MNLNLYKRKEREVWTQRDTETEAEFGVLSTSPGTSGASRSWKREGKILP